MRQGIEFLLTFLIKYNLDIGVYVFVCVRVQEELKIKINAVIHVAIYKFLFFYSRTEIYFCIYHFQPIFVNVHLPITCFQECNFYFVVVFLLQDLVMDPNQHVKSALASVIMGLSPMLGNDK